MRLLERYIKSFLFERGRFRKGTELSGWLIGLDCTKEEFNQVFENFPEKNQSVGRNIFNAGTFIFDKDESILDYIEERLGVDKIDKVGDEFSDNLPVFICINQGDVLSQDLGKKSLINNLDWMVHDIWHRLVDFNAWFRHISKKSNNVHIKSVSSYSASSNSEIKNSEFEKLNNKDALVFLNYYNFTSGVGENDALPSLAAFCVMNRSISRVDDKIFKDKMEDYESFASFYERLYVLGPLLWNSLFKLFQGKVVCLNMF
jgi:hypothetical protein